MAGGGPCKCFQQAAALRLMAAALWLPLSALLSHSAGLRVGVGLFPTSADSGCKKGNWDRQIIKFVVPFTSGKPGYSGICCLSHTICVCKTTKCGTLRRRAGGKAGEGPVPQRAGVGLQQLNGLKKFKTNSRSVEPRCRLSIPTARMRINMIYCVELLCALFLHYSWQWQHH